MINIILAVILFVTILYLDVQSDYKKWKQNKPVKHFKEWIFRALFLVPSAILLTLPSLGICNLLISAGLIASVWWELFDGFYNRKRGFEWRFNGSVDEDDSKLDKFLYTLTVEQQALLKLGLIIIFTILYIFI